MARAPSSPSSGKHSHACCPLKESRRHRQWAATGAQQRPHRQAAAARPSPSAASKTGLRATLTTQAGQPTVGQQADVPNQVARDTIFTFLAGKPIFELTAPDGHVYVMQSCSQIVNPRLTYRDLPRLGCVLKLPAGCPTPRRRSRIPSS